MAPINSSPPKILPTSQIPLIMTSLRVMEKIIEFFLVLLSKWFRLVFENQGKKLLRGNGPIGKIVLT